MAASGPLVGCGAAGRPAKGAEKNGSEIERGEQATLKRQEAAELAEDRQLLTGIEDKRLEAAASENAKRTEAIAKAKAEKIEKAAVRNAKHKEAVAEENVKKREKASRAAATNEKEVSGKGEATETKPSGSRGNTKPKAHV